MSNYDLIRDRLDEFHVNFPSYSERGVQELDVLARIFDRDTAGWSEEKVNLVFDKLLRGKKFPQVGDVLEVGADTMTQQEIDDFKYRSLKAKDESPSWFLSGPEQAFVQKYEAKLICGTKDRARLISQAMEDE